MKREKRIGEGRPRKKECECGRSIEKEWATKGNERFCLSCDKKDRDRAFDIDRKKWQ